MQDFPSRSTDFSVMAHSSRIRVSLGRFAIVHPFVGLPLKFARFALSAWGSLPTLRTRARFPSPALEFSLVSIIAL